MQVLPYNISHLSLESQDEFEIPWSKTEGQYIVFWWRCIAIGELYFNAGVKLDDKGLRKKIISAITPAVDMYMMGKAPEAINFKKAFVNKDHLEFSKGMNEIFSDFIPRMIPPGADVSVVICTRNRSEYLKKCLESFGNQKCMPMEIIVVDNAPVDDSTYNVTKEFRMVKYVKEPRPGLDIARNAGARAAMGSIVAYTDDDVELHPWWIYQVNETFAKTSAAAMTGLVIASELKTESQQIFEKYWSFNRGYTDKLYDPYFLIEHLAVGPPVWDIGAGANMAFRKSSFQKAGYFDERLDVGAAGCNGDSEMWYRLLLKGGSINYNPRAVVFHEHRKEIKSLKKQLYSYMRGFAAAALIQQSQNSNAGYAKHLYYKLPVHYLKLILRGFPRYHSRYTTVFDELRGVWSGIMYYKNHKNQSRF
ncbi:MAG TPA: glycosyltransferase [Flavitalea sp.]|nr:glycosyltransferase [Flavitalea sp.]